MRARASVAYTVASATPTLGHQEAPAFTAFWTFPLSVLKIGSLNRYVY